jgi:hypothetical protein
LEFGPARRFRSAALSLSPGRERLAGTVDALAKDENEECGITAPSTKKGGAGARWIRANADRASRRALRLHADGSARPMRVDTTAVRPAPARGVSFGHDE